MREIDDWMGFAVPARDSNNVRHRRVEQGDRAMESLQVFAPVRRVIVQAGGNWGYWPRRLAGLFDTVYTFEPDPVCFSCLSFNTAPHHNVVRLQAALGYERTLVDLWRDEDTTGNQHIDGPGIYPTLRIDDLGLDICDVIYLDIEGCEAEALRGAKETIERCRPLIIFEERQAFEENVKQAWGACPDYRQTGAIGADIVLAHEEEFKAA